MDVNKQFILEELIPFIQREQGRGFAMTTWLGSGYAGEIPPFDCIENREAPICGTIACIGGSTEFLIHKKDPGIDFPLSLSQVYTFLGLTDDQGEILRYGWIRSWPEPFKSQLANARTTQEKAEAAVSLLKRVVETNGAILDGAIWEIVDE